MEKSFYELWKLGINFIKTKIFFPKARLIRFPFDIRGKKFIKFGKNFTTGTGCRIEAYSFQDKNISNKSICFITIKKNSYIFQKKNIAIVLLEKNIPLYLLRVLLKGIQGRACDLIFFSVLI